MIKLMTQAFYWYKMLKELFRYHRDKGLTFLGTIILIHTVINKELITRIL